MPRQRQLPDRSDRRLDILPSYSIAYISTFSEAHLFWYGNQMDIRHPRVTMAHCRTHKTVLVLGCLTVFPSNLVSKAVKPMPVGHHSVVRFDIYSYPNAASSSAMMSLSISTSDSFKFSLQGGIR